MKSIAPLLFAFIVIAMPVSAKQYIIDYENSTVAFSGTHVGNEFKGQFNEWQGDIIFDPENLEISHTEITFELSSAKTGNKVYDGTLPKSDWFDIENHPQGTFKSTGFSKNEDGSYKVEGMLGLRGQEHPITFDFTLSDLDVSPVVMTAELPVDRLQYDIGRKSDEKAEWVSQDIKIILNVTATAAQ